MLPILKFLYEGIIACFFKVIAPVEIKVALIFIIMAVVVDRVRRYMSGPAVPNNNSKTIRNNHNL